MRISTASELSLSNPGPRQRVSRRGTIIDATTNSPSCDVQPSSFKKPLRVKRYSGAQWRSFGHLVTLVIIIGSGAIVITFGLYWILETGSQRVPLSKVEPQHNMEVSPRHKERILTVNTHSHIKSSLRSRQKETKTHYILNFPLPIPTITIQLPPHLEQWDPDLDHSSPSVSKDTPHPQATHDYGGLEIKMLDLDSFRQLRFDTYSDMLNEEELLEEQEDDWLQSMDEDYQSYYAFDDDYTRGRRVAYDGVNPNEDADSSCRRVAEYRLAFPTCNDIHHLDYAAGNTFGSDFSYINHGTFRDVFAMDHSFSSAQEKIAIKEIRYGKSDADLELFEYVRMDALVAERFSHSPRTFDIYGYCGLSLVSEFFYHGDIEDRAMPDDGHPAPDTVMTPEQKLVLALEMAEGLAQLHGYAHGMILHSDVQMGQFLLNRDKTMLKLNDFNRAEILLWDESHNAYCQHRNGKGHGNWRSPEEYRNDPLTDKIDVWSLANNMYALLTGVDPILADDDAMKASDLLIEGKTGRIDSKYSERNGPERVLAEIIQRCFSYEPANRPTMFEIVEKLEKAVSQVERQRGMSRQAILQTL